MVDALCSLPLIATLLARCAPPPPLATGYVEGEYVQAAPLATARIAEVMVRRGDVLRAGQVLARMDTADAQGTLDGAEARLLRAQSELADLTHGSRPEELAALEAAVTAARTAAAQAKDDAARAERLSARGASSRAQSDTLRTAADVAAARLAESEARLAAARLPGRADRIAAARAAVAEAEAARDTARWQLDQRSIRADAPGIVSDLIREPGEIAGPAAPVLCCRMAPSGCGSMCRNRRCPRSRSGCGWRCPATAAPRRRPGSPGSPTGPSSRRPSSIRANRGKSWSIWSRPPPRRRPP